MDKILKKPIVTIITPVHNAERWLADALDSVIGQTFSGSLELSVYLDACTDRSEEIVYKWKDEIEARGINLIISQSEVGCEARGVGYAKNVAVRQSTGEFLCYLDADDLMMPERIQRQYDLAKDRPTAIVGCQFHRDPAGSTTRFTDWANHLDEIQLYTQAFTSHGPTLIMPTWFCSRAVYDVVGGFHEGGKGVPEDLIFFYDHLKLGGELVRVDADLLMYRYHPHCSTFTVTEDTIWQHRLAFLEQQVLTNWVTFTIWNAGKQGRRFYRSLSAESRRKVQAFCDVDTKKIKQGMYTYHESEVCPRPTVPIVHFSQAAPPFIICVKLGLTDGQFEANLASLALVEGRDYYHFN